MAPAGSLVPVVVHLENGSIVEGYDCLVAVAAIYNNACWERVKSRRGACAEWTRRGGVKRASPYVADRQGRYESCG